MTTPLPDYPRGLTFEDVWAALMEDREQMRKHREEHEKEHLARMEELEKERQTRMEEQRVFREEHRVFWEERQVSWEKQDARLDKLNAALDKSREDFDRRIKVAEKIVSRNGKQLGELHHRFGQLAEHMVTPGMDKRFTELGYNIKSYSPYDRFKDGIKIYDGKGNVKTQLDIVLEGEDFMIVIEVKTRPVEQDIEHHIKRLEIIREYRISSDKRKILGAIAGAIFEPHVKEVTLKAGMYVVEQSGDTMKIDIPQDFIPREW